MHACTYRSILDTTEGYKTKIGSANLVALTPIPTLITCKSWANLYTWGSESVFCLAHFITGLAIAIPKLMRALGVPSLQFLLFPCLPWWPPYEVHTLGNEWHVKATVPGLSQKKNQHIIHSTIGSGVMLAHGTNCR